MARDLNRKISVCPSPSLSGRPDIRGISWYVDVLALAYWDGLIFRACLGTWIPYWDSLILGRPDIQGMSWYVDSLALAYWDSLRPDIQGITEHMWMP
jgi:hypothetical protein